MDAEIREIRDHIAQFPPFDHLSESLLDEIALSVEIVYQRAGSQIVEYGDPIHDLYYLRSGAVEVYRHNGELYNRLSEGDIFGHFGLLRNRKVRFPAKAIEDTLLYLIPDRVFDHICAEDGLFADFVELSGTRLRSTFEQYERENDMMVTRIRKLLVRSPVMVEESATVQEAAQRMSEEQVSSVLLLRPGEGETAFTDSEGGSWILTGIVTDQDLRQKVLAVGGTAQTRLVDIQGGLPITIQSDESVYEAMLVMLRNNIHHLPVLHRRRPAGVVHLSDIVRYETSSSLYLVSNIFNQASAKGITRLMPDVRAAFVRLVDEGATSQMIGSAMATIGRSVMRRLIELAEIELGPPPVPYCYMANGSMARDEQSILTDQDNAMILHDSYDPQQHGDYFTQLAQRVSDGLDSCGYSYCKGGIMASNEQWRQPLSVWQRYFSDWIEKPDAQKLLHSSIFFDLEPIHGEEQFVETLQALIAQKASRSPRFLAALARNALNRTPPLGFFRTFVMEQDGKHNNSINLKRRGTAPMVDVIRLHALAIGSTAQNSYARLDDITEAGKLPAGQADKLRYALDFLTMVRLRHQAYDLKQNQEVDNNIEPENVSATERHNLKDAFQVLSGAQKFLRYHYQGGPR